MKSTILKIIKNGKIEEQLNEEIENRELDNKPTKRLETKRDKAYKDRTDAENKLMELLKTNDLLGPEQAEELFKKYDLNLDDVWRIGNGWC